MADMAVQLNCSERHLSRLFRVEFGMSLRKKQTELSLQRACQLLLDPNVKIRSVASETGYRYVSFFNALFKKRFGLTPKEWRQQQIPAPAEDFLKRGGIPPAEAAETASDARTIAILGNHSVGDSKKRSQTHIAGAQGESGNGTAIRQKLI